MGTFNVWGLTMVEWRKNTLPMATYGDLQDFVLKLISASGPDPDMALFCKREIGAENADFFLAAPVEQADIVERVYPGWETIQNPAGPGFEIVLGDNSAWERFGFERP